MNVQCTAWDDVNSTNGHSVFLSSSFTGWIQYARWVSHDNSVRWIVAADLPHYRSTSLGSCLSIEVTFLDRRSIALDVLSTVLMMEIPRLKSSMKSNGTTKPVQALFIIFETKTVSRTYHSEQCTTTSVRLFQVNCSPTSSVILRVAHGWKRPIRNRWGEKGANDWFHRRVSSLLSGRMTRSVSDETETTVEPMTREQQLTPPQTPTTTMRQTHDSSSFFGRRRRHRSHPHHRQHHRQSSRSRRMEVSSKGQEEPFLVFLLSCLVRDIHLRSTGDHHRRNSTTDSQ